MRPLFHIYPILFEYIKLMKKFSRRICLFAKYKILIKNKKRLMLGESISQQRGVLGASFEGGL